MVHMSLFARSIIYIINTPRTTTSPRVERQINIFIHKYYVILICLFVPNGISNRVPFRILNQYIITFLT